MKLLTFLARRYIAGKTRADAIRVAKRLNREGLLATIDNVGENVTNSTESRKGVEEYADLLEDISGEGVDSTISVKLTHLGLDISDELARENMEMVLEKAAWFGNSVRIDMEGSKYTKRTLEIFTGLAERFPDAGIAVQSCLRRSAADVKLLIEAGRSVRLVKGAYKEPTDIAFEKKADVDGNFSVLMKELLLKGSQPAIATHDEKLIEEALRFAKENNIDRSRFDFEMLLGIKRKLQKKLAEEGYRVRVYVPYGKNWLPYVLRRLTERKENIWFVIKNIFD